MTTLYNATARLCLCAAVLVTILGLLAASANVRADESTTSDACCTAEGHTGMMWEYCVSQCLQGKGPCGLYVKYRSSCPNGNNKDCSINDGNMNGCPGISCSEGKKWACLCKYDTVANKCNCPK